MVLFIATILPLLALLAAASPYPPRDALQLRQDAGDPQFPASPASCGLCQQVSLPPWISSSPSAAGHTSTPDVMPISDPFSFAELRQYKALYVRCTRHGELQHGTGNFSDVSRSSFMNPTDHFESRFICKCDYVRVRRIYLASLISRADT